MGSKLSVQRQKEAVFLQLQAEFVIEDHPLNPDSDCIKLLRDRQTPTQTYLLRILTTNSQTENDNWESQLNSRLQQKQQYGLPLHRFFGHKMEHTCGTVSLLYVLFRVDNVSSLES